MVRDWWINPQNHIWFSYLCQECSLSVMIEKKKYRVGKIVQGLRNMASMQQNLVQLLLVQDPLNITRCSPEDPWALQGLAGVILALQGPNSMTSLCLGSLCWTAGPAGWESPRRTPTLIAPPQKQTKNNTYIINRVFSPTTPIFQHKVGSTVKYFPSVLLLSSIAVFGSDNKVRGQYIF